MIIMVIPAVMVSCIYSLIDSMSSIIFIIFTLTFYFNHPFRQSAAFPQPTIKTYKINLDQSELIILVYKAGIASSFGHNHVVKAEQFKGTITFDKNLLSSSFVNIEVNAGSLKADLPEMRRKYKLEGELSAGDMKKIEKDMMEDDQLDTVKYHVMKFRSESLIENDSDNYLVFGDLTIHGITKRISAAVNIKVKGASLIAYSSFKIKQSDFNIEPFSTALGFIKNRDEIQIIFNFTANLSKSVPK